MAPRKDKNSLWYKDAVIYQLHVKTFYDSNGDGVGDFKGLTQKLDYLKNLGVTAIWLLPFYPSPMKDDGYDIADYYDVNPQFGTLRDFKEMLKEAHRRGLQVITELVINHTSDQHPWFQRARRAAPGSNYRDYYVWSDTTDKYNEARIIFKDFESSNWSWDEEAKAYFWHRFYSHQPDLNFDNPRVQSEIFKVADFWFGLGVDGVRLDAIPYLYEREGTNCENLPETYQFLARLRKHVDSKFKNKMLLAEANQWPEDAVAYFGKGDMCNMAFHFPLMPRMYMALQMEDRFPIIDILNQTPDIPKSTQWAIFLRNHDELTLEMVTDEERDYMYRAYAEDDKARINLGIRRRLFPLLKNNRRKIELINILLFSLPGTPIIYYGDEIGMGDNFYLGDRNGVRTPMQWSPDRNAGFSTANPQSLYLPVIIDWEYHYGSVNVETQEANLSSMLSWLRRVIAMRKQFQSLSRGTIQFLPSDNPKVLTFIRQYGQEIMLIVINLSRFSQPVELDLSEYASFYLEEVFSGNTFPSVREGLYPLTLGPHDHFWFLLKKSEQKEGGKPARKQPRLKVERDWKDVFEGEALKLLETEILPVYVSGRRWFGQKSQTIRKVRLEDFVDLKNSAFGGGLALIEVSYSRAVAQTYLLPVGFKHAHEAAVLIRDYPDSIICRMTVNGREGVLYDGAYDPACHHALLSVMSGRKAVKGVRGQLKGVVNRSWKKMLGEHTLPIPSKILKAEQSNTAIIYDDVFFMKLFRKLEQGINPDAEIVRHLTEKKKFPNTPSFAGSLIYEQSRSKPIVLSLTQSLVPNQGDAWSYSLDNVQKFFEQALLRKQQRIKEGADGPEDVIRPDDIRQMTDGFYLEMVRLLARRTAEMHLALGEDTDDPGFAPESFSTLYQRALLQAMGSQARSAMEMLKTALPRLAGNAQKEAQGMLESRSKIMARLKQITKTKITARKIRTHGDYHLGQVLFTGKDFFIIDFEGEPLRSLSERRLKHSALKDVAGMLRSFHYAAYAELLLRKSISGEDAFYLEKWADAWSDYVNQEFIASYFDTIGNSPLLPRNREQRELLLKVYLLDKAMYELGYEINNRPDWILIPLRGIQYVLNKKNLLDKKKTPVKENESGSKEG